MRKTISFVFTLVAANFLLAKQALAICPVCTVAVGAGLGFSRWLGIDDSIAGLWIGGLVVSFIFWTFGVFEKKNIKYFSDKLSVIVGWYALTFIPLYYAKMIDLSLTNNLNIGIIVGSIAFWSAADWHFYLKAKNDNKVYFPFQKVVIPVATLSILSLVFYFLTR